MTHVTISKEVLLYCKETSDTFKKDGITNRSKQLGQSKSHDQRKTMRTYCWLTREVCKTMGFMWLCPLVLCTSVSNKWHKRISVFSFQNFRYVALYCDTVVYNSTPVIFRGTILMYAVMSPATVQKEDILRSPTTSIAFFMAITNNPCSPSLYIKISDGSFLFAS